MKKKFLLIGIALPVLSLLCWGITTQTMLLKCRSDSLSNISYLLVKKGSSFNRGDIVCLQGHRVKYIDGDKSLAKRVLGLPGDQIQKEQNTIKLIPQENNVKLFLLPLVDQTSKGEVLTPLSLTAIPEGYAFVAGDHPKSFDSRYEEFGLVNIENIKGRTIWWW